MRFMKLNFSFFKKTITFPILTMCGNSLSYLTQICCHTVYFQVLIIWLHKKYMDGIIEYKLSLKQGPLTGIMSPLTILTVDFFTLHY